MNARPAFADSSTRRPITQFAGDTNPWTKQAMPSATSSLPTSPFSIVGNRTTPKRNGPAPGSSKYRPRVDLSTLKIEHGIPLPMHRKNEGKYADYFAKMQPKDCITCKTDEVTALANAMRKWLKDNNKVDTLAVISVKTIPEDPERGAPADPEHGRVWLWPKGEAPNWMPAKSRGGAILAQQRRAGKAAK